MSSDSLLYLAMSLRSVLTRMSARMPERKRTMATLLQMANQCTCEVGGRGGKGGGCEVRGRVSVSDGEGGVGEGYWRRGDNVGQG